MNLITNNNLSEKVDINALANELSFLIENPNELIAIEKNEQNEKVHHYIKIAKKYLEVWKKL